VVQAYFTAFASGNVDAALALMSEDVIWHVDGDAGVSTAGLLQGREQVRCWLDDFPRHFTPRVFVIDKLLEHDEDVVALGRFRHTVQDTRRTVGSDLAIRFCVRGGHIARYQIFEDSALLARSFDPADCWQRQQIRINHTVYTYFEQGEGPAVLFAHGLFVDHTMFDAQVAALKSTHRCIVFDMPGHGESGYRAAGWTLDELARDLALMIKEHALGPVTFVGQSQGGMVGIHLAARWPDCVARLVLIGTSARAEFPERIEHWRHLRNTILHGAQDERDAAFRAVQDRVKGAAWLYAHPEQALRERTRMLAHHRTGVTLALDAATIKRPDIRELLPRITAPTLVVCGELDLATPLALSEELAQAIPCAQLKVMAGVGHHPPVEAPEALTALMANFLHATIC
jgi:pimeloyl-ACP methyl ester carboxylesterase